MIFDKFPNWDIDVENGTVYSLKHKKIYWCNKQLWLYICKWVLLA